MIINLGDRIRDYVVQKQLGEGGMGTVYLAEDTMLERKVAVKVLSPTLTEDTQFVARFRQEAKVQSTLLHSGIVSLHTFFQEAKLYCMVMEYAEGETLKSLIERIGPLPEERALKIFRQVLDAVKYAHSKGIIHRDLKPSNIMLGRDDMVKVMDFGIAKILGERGMTRTGAKVGTLFYMSPEQVLAAKDIDSRTDIYSLGVTLYEMLTGRLPYDTHTESDFEIMREIVESSIPDPRNLNPHISAQTVSLLSGMLAKDRGKRSVSRPDHVIDPPVVGWWTEAKDPERAGREVRISISGNRREVLYPVNARKGMKESTKAFFKILFALTALFFLLIVVLSIYAAFRR